MRRTAATIAGLLLVLLAASPAQAAKPPAGSNDPLAFVLQPDVQNDNLVEQQTDWPFPADSAEWTINPYDFCQWDVDDHWQFFGRGYLAAGASVSLDQCVVSDPVSIYRTINGTTAWWSQETKYIALSLTARTVGLDVSVCYQPQGRCFHPQPIVGSYSVRYESCTQVRYSSPDDPAVYEIPGSQGGVGVLTTVTITVSNPTNRTIRDIVSGTGPSWLNSVSSNGCGGHSTDIVREYPYRFYVS